MDPSPAIQIANHNEWWQYGAIGVMAIIFLYGIIALWRRSEKRDEKMDAERARMIAERETWVTQRTLFEQRIEDAKLEMRAEFDEKHVAIVERYDELFRQEREANRGHEDAVRREFAEIVEAMATQATESASATLTVLNKLHDRVLGPRRRGGA